MCTARPRSSPPSPEPGVSVLQGAPDSPPRGQLQQELPDQQQQQQQQQEQQEQQKQQQLLQQQEQQQQEQEQPQLLHQEQERQQQEQQQQEQQQEQQQPEQPQQQQVLVAANAELLIVAAGAAPGEPLGVLVSSEVVDQSLSSSLTSFSSIDDDMLPDEIAAAKEAAQARAAAARPSTPSSVAGFLPPIEYSALCGLCICALLASLTNWACCKPVMLSHCLLRTGQHRIMLPCASCLAPPAAQAQHAVFLQRQPQPAVLQPLPLPLRQYLELDQLPAPTYRVPPLVSLPAPDESSFTGALTAVQEWLHSRAAYQMQQLGTSHVSTKVLALWLFALPFIVVFAAAYQRAAHVGFREACYKVYALLMRVPGIGIAKESNVASYLVANTVFLAGVFSFAAVIGIVSDEIKTSIKSSRAGNYNMRLADHILLLNWNSSSCALLRQIASAYADGGMFYNGMPWPFSNRPPVVVLADKDKAAMDSAINEMLRDRGLKLEVHTRSGVPFKGSDLRKVAASKASTIIVLHPESTNSANAEAIKVSVAMSLAALGPPAEQRVVMQGPSPGTHTVLHSLEATCGHAAIQAFELPDSQLTHRLVAQTAAQPGILTCWLDVLALTSSSSQFYTAPLPASLEGKPYQQVRRAFVHAVLCGYRLASGEVVLNPPEDAVVPAGSSLVLLGRGGAPHIMASPDSQQLYDSAATAAAERLKRERTYKSKARNIVVAAWNPASISQLMDGFSLFTPPGSTVTFTLAEEPPAGAAGLPSSQGGCRFRWVVNPQPTSVKALLDAGIKGADAVVLGSGSPAAGSELEADARLLASILQVQDAVIASKRREAPHLVAPIHRYATSKLASQYLDVLAAEAAPQGGASSAQLLPAAAVSASAPGAQLAALAMPAAGPAAAASAPAAGPAAPAAAAEAGSGGSGATSSAGGGGSSASGSSGSAGNGSSSSGGLLAAAWKAVALPSSGGGGSSSSGGQPPPAQPNRPPVITEPEFLVPTDVSSALMTQVLSEPAYSAIMGSLLIGSAEPAQQELYLRNPASFNIPINTRISFAEVAEAVRLTQQTAVGYIRGQGSGAAGGGHLAVKHLRAGASVRTTAAARQRKAVLGCGAAHTLAFGPHDRIVVIARDFNA